LVACTDEGVLIRRYDMFLRSKRVRHEQIGNVEEFPLGRMRGKWRIWGTGDFRHWFNFDRSRPGKQVGLSLDLGRRWISVITPDDPPRVVAALREHAVDVRER
jgi:hypothetical protein